MGTAVLETSFDGDVFAAVDLDAGPRGIVDVTESQSVNDHIVDVFKRNGNFNFAETVDHHCAGLGCSESERRIFVPP